MSIRIVTIDDPDLFQVAIRELGAFGVDLTIVNGNTLEVITNNIPNNTSDDTSNSNWLDECIKQLPTLSRDLANIKRNRQVDRCYQHTISLVEFILLVKLHNWGNMYLEIAKSLGDAEYHALSTMLVENGDDNSYSHGYGIISFIETIMLGKEVNFLRIRDGNMLYGDIIRHDFITSRNQGVFVFTGDIAIPLAIRPDDYGTVPRIFPAITEFPIMYFSDAITHNTYIWIPKGIHCQHDIITNFVYDEHDNTKIQSELTSLSIEVDEINIAIENNNSNFNSNLDDNIKICVIITNNNLCTYNGNIDNHNNNINNVNYVVVLYTNQQELQDELDILFRKGKYGQYFGEHLAIVNGDQYLV